MRLIGLWGISGDAEEIVENFNLTEIYDAGVVSDFLSMDAETFEKNYNKNALYEKDILYCTEEAWRFQGVAGPAVDDTLLYEMDDIRAVRFINVWPQDTVIYEETELYNQYNLVRRFGDYAVSMYFQESRDETGGKEAIRLIEFSFVKIKMSEYDSGKADIDYIYRNQEYDYYWGWRERGSGEWSESPQGTKAVYLLNWIIPNGASQIYVRYQEKRQDLIFRDTWERLFAGWIDEDHFLCYNDGGLYMVHTETGRIEEIITGSAQEDDFEAWGCHYEIKGNQVIATCANEKVFHWDIVSSAGEVALISREMQNNLDFWEEDFGRITKYLDEQVPEIWNEWSDYVENVSEGEAHIYERMAGEPSPEDVYRDYEKTEYLGKYYLVYVGEMWEDHSVNWAYFYVSENCDEVLWYDHIARLDNEYPVLYLDEWRNSDFYPRLDRSLKESQEE